MKSEDEIREKLKEADKKASEALKESYDGDMNGVNRGAMYGWEEALNWVLDE